jgi:hypothetical protein
MSGKQWGWIIPEFVCDLWKAARLVVVMASVPKRSHEEDARLFWDAAGECSK